MKTKLLLILVVLLMCSMSNYAQVDKVRNSCYVQWNPSSYVPKDGKSQSFTGLTIGYNR